MTNHIVIASVILGVALLGTGYMYSQKDIIISSSQTPFGTIQVSAEGKAKAIPDTTILQAGVEVIQAKTQEDGYTQMNTSINQIKALLKNAGIEEKNVQSTNLSVTQEYDYTEGKQTPNGYRASQMLTIRIEQKEASVTNSLLDAIAKVKNIQIQGVSYETLDTEKVYSEARKMALEKARQKADEIAQATGVKIRKVLSVSESTQNMYPTPLYGNVKMMDTMESSVGNMDISQGELEYMISLNVSYEIE